MKLCECGCGEPTPLAPRSRARLGWKKGEPTRYVPGHRKRRPAVERFLEKVAIGEIPEWRPELGRCWAWTAGCNHTGYAVLWVLEEKSNRVAHRISYEFFVGTIPDGTELDHLCRNRGCVNPAHLEAVSHSVNVSRGHDFRGPKSHCINGHPYDEANTWVGPNGKRACRTCNRLRAARRRYSATQSTARVEAVI